MANKGSKKHQKEEEIEEKVTANDTDAQEEQVEETVEEGVDKDENEENTEELSDQSEEEMSEEEKKIEELSLKVSELNDRYLRLTAEYDNYRKRTLKERMELMKTAGEGLLKGLLPVVDDFDRAILHLDEASDLEAVKEGIDLIYNKFQEFLKQNGVVEIEAKEKDFDTDLHEAITKIPAPTEEMKGKVMDCVEKGYMLNDKVMRFSKVVVGE
ncbi:nucleotide exchange factor GrpE [Saccharicrinis fermentans]|uniref:Protein GrpE n=1 Tax=Saccharicrinis fermentans DSM 9555 = JCM 21142 TaxID=869213 RepID=W7Y2V1_9BACT|nr:nucleotide exchange factor GrpE [Saccharicrinis fermentans]GAF05155.1 HSP-70 cofactor [Saccharicrinis fermentans DSM 9555 = JCM 21142]